jgi:hypothetical protein
MFQNMNNQMMGMSNQMMGMNNPMMGMNNQMNDDITRRIKTIVEPYEKKIKELEEQIRQKDFEIAVLKEKCYQAEKNNINNNFQGINPFQIPMGMNNIDIGLGMPPMVNMNNNNEYSDIITLIFRGINDIKIIQKCFIDDEFGFVQKKILKKINNPSDIKFIFNAKNTIPNLTVSELGMTDNANIFMVKVKISNNNSNTSNISLKSQESSSFKIRIMFKTSQGVLLNIPFDNEISVGSALQKYLIRVNREDLIKSNQEKIVFIYNASKLSINDNRRLKDIILGDQATIFVNDISNLIGANTEL